MVTLPPDFNSRAAGRASDYVKFLKHASDVCPNLTELYEFASQNLTSVSNPIATTSVIQISDEGFSQYQEVTKTISSLPDLINHLDLARDQPAWNRLYIVEDLDPQTLAILGSTFDLPPLFFADHIDTANWHRIDEVPRHLPRLESVKNQEPFFRVRFVAPRAFEPEDDADSVTSFLYPDKSTTWILRKAGKFRGRARNGKFPKNTLLTRHFITVWFSDRKPGRGWNGKHDDVWNRATLTSKGIILLQPEFKPDMRRGRCGPSEYRTFCGRPGGMLHHGQFYDRRSIRHSFEHCLRQDLGTIKDSIIEPFVLLKPLFRIIASEWNVTLTYLLRELITLEHHLESGEPTLEVLEVYLKDLYKHRRRTTLYQTAIAEARDLCRSRGKISWPRGTSDGPAATVRADLILDFDEIGRLAQKLDERITKNINLLTALVAIEEGKLAGEKAYTVTALTYTGVIFIPFATVAGILSIDGEYRPGGPKFWIFWTSAVPLVVFILLLCYYNRGLSLLISHLGSSQQVAESAGHQSYPSAIVAKTISVSRTLRARSSIDLEKHDSMV